MQKQFTEIRFVEALAQLLELIYYKTIPEEYREKAYKPDKLRHDYHDRLTEDHEGFHTARILLDDLNHLILEILLLLIKENVENSDRLTRYNATLKNQFLRADQDLVLKLICHMYKTAEFIFNDRSSVFLSYRGINQYIPEQFTK